MICPFIECKKEFRHSGNLKTHMRSHVSSNALFKIENKIYAYILSFFINQNTTRFSIYFQISDKGSFPFELG